MLAGPPRGVGAPGQEASSLVQPATMLWTDDSQRFFVVSTKSKWGGHMVRHLSHLLVLLFFLKKIASDGIASDSS